jgi:hypothetical protein
MRERAAMFGGELETATADDGGFTVETTVVERAWLFGPAESGKRVVLRENFRVSRGPRDRGRSARWEDKELRCREVVVFLASPAARYPRLHRQMRVGGDECGKS